MLCEFAHKASPSIFLLIFVSLFYFQDYVILSTRGEKVRLEEYLDKSISAARSGKLFTAGTSATSAATSGKLFNGEKSRSFDFAKVKKILDSEDYDDTRPKEVERPCSIYAVVTTIFEKTEAVSDILKVNKTLLLKNFAEHKFRMLIGASL